MLTEKTRDIIHELLITMTVVLFKACASKKKEGYNAYIMKKRLSLQVSLAF